MSRPHFGVGADGLILIEPSDSADFAMRIYNADGSEADIVEIYDFGTEISIHKAPVRKGYTFDYWKGSEYHPDDAYTVTEDHTFIAQWKADSPPPDPPDPPDKPDKPDKPDTPGTGETASGITYSLALMLMAAYGGVYALRRRIILSQNARG